jgi:hypothetical protein
LPKVTFGRTVKTLSIAPASTAARAALAALFVLFVALPALEAGEPLRPSRASKPPVIDGRLDDDVWQTSARVTGFRTWMPDYGVTMTNQTVVYMAYDAENLYFAFRAFDAEPSKIKASMANRDNIRPDDWICINLDSFNDQQALYAFYVNPLGIQMDSSYTGNQEDMGFDAVWYSAGTVDAGGYSVEVRLPFKSLRYGGHDVVTMGVVFERFVSRRNEDGTWPALDPKAGANFLIQTTPMEFRDIRHYTLLEVLPDAVYSRQDVAQGGNLARVNSGGDFGVTAKYGITAQLTADGTYNPDFSQVEADAGQIDVNLRAPLFFPEKRPFFLEGQDVFVLGGPSQQSPLQSVIHTRTIVNPQAGFKVSGKLGRADTISSLYALDDVRNEAAPDWAQVAVVRYKRALRQDAYLGGYYVGREQGSDFNHVAGVDGRIRLDRSSAIGLYAFGSDTKAGDESPRPGHAIGLDFMRETRRVSVYAMGVDISTGFEAESGYLTRNGVTSFMGAVVPRLYPKRGIVQRVDLSAVAGQTRDAFSGIWESSNDGAVTLRMKGAATVKFSYRFSSEVYNGEEFGTSGPSATASMQVVKQLRVQGSFGHTGAIYYATDPFGGTTTRGALSVVYQPSEQWSETLSASYATFTSNTGVRLYDYTIARSRTSYQVNRFLFFRAIVEYNWFRRQLLTDLLASFTYIPGTVLHAGYGSLYERSQWDGGVYVRADRFEEMRRGVFLKASYLWRM